MKLYNSGIAFYNEYKVSWAEFSSWEEWSITKEKYNIGGNDEEFVRQGYCGEGFSPPGKSTFIFPFGTHKGKPIEKVPLKYLKWCAAQSWLDSWPGLEINIKSAIDNIEGDMATADDFRKISEQIKKL